MTEHTYVVDMSHATLPASGSADIPDQNQEDAALIIPKVDWHSIGRALLAGVSRGTLNVTARRNVKEGLMKVDYRVSLNVVDTPMTGRAITTFIATIDLNNGGRTRLEMKLGRSERNGRVELWTAVQGNGTTLLTGQNIWPVEVVLKSARRQLALMFAWPYLALIGICKAADPKFKPSVALLRAVLRGEASYQNVQFAMNMGLV